MNFFDMHCDTATRIYDEGEQLACATGHVSTKKAEAFDCWIQAYAVFIDDQKRKGDAFMYYLAVKENLQQQWARQRVPVVQCRTAQDLQTVLHGDGRGAILTVENGAVLGGDVRRLDQMEQDGVKLLTLTWYGENELGYGSGVGGKMKPFGLEVLRALPRYGIIPDISHLSDEGVEQVFDAWKGPLVASHSNVRAVTPHERNLTDAQIDEMVRRNGLIGINLYEPFLSSEQTASSEDVYRHISAFLARGAEKNLCFGTDFDGAQVPADIKDISGIPALVEYLLAHGIEEATLQDVFFNNAFSFWQRVLQ